MSAALQIYYAGFDAVFFRLSAAIRMRIEAKIDEVGLRLGTFPHHRLKGSGRYRLRVGNYRIIYTFDLDHNAIHLSAIGHRAKSIVIYNRIEKELMSKAKVPKKPTLETLAAQMRRLQKRVEDMEDLIELRLAVERNAGKPGVPWER